MHALSTWDSINEQLANDLPWLQRLCASYTGQSAAAEDLAQETLLIAWRRREQLRDAQALRPWLATIARNVCRHWRRSQQRAAVHQCRPAPSSEHDQHTQIASAPDPFHLELALERDELATLLDRALALLTADAREALIQHYIEELPQSELAARFGIQPGALAVRLYRGKLALRKILLTQFHEEAAAYGFVTAIEDSWQETRIWCPICGTKHLHGRVVANQVQFDCIGCLGLERSVLFRANFSGPVPPFRPALEKLLKDIQLFNAHGQPQVLCPYCQRPLSFGVNPTRKFDHFFYMEANCSGCGSSFNADTAVASLVLANPQGRRFWKGQGRICTLPDQQIEIHGQPAIMTRLQGVQSGEQFTMLIASHNLTTIAIYPQ